MADYLLQQQERKLTAAYFDKHAFRQTAKALLILQTGVAGLKYHIDLSTEEGQKWLENMVPGTKLKLYRDMDNEHDKWAVSIYTQDDQHIGYITRFKSETVARLLDYGKQIYAIVDEKKVIPADPVQYRRTITHTERFEVPISVYMLED